MPSPLGADSPYQGEMAEGQRGEGTVAAEGGDG